MSSPILNEVLSITAQEYLLGQRDVLVVVSSMKS